MMHEDESDLFFDYLLDQYGENVFSVVPANLTITLTDIVREAESHGLKQVLPQAFYYDDDDDRGGTGDYEIIVAPTLEGNWQVGVFAVFGEE